MCGFFCDARLPAVYAGRYRKSLEWGDPEFLRTFLDWGRGTSVFAVGDFASRLHDRIVMSIFLQSAKSNECHASLCTTCSIFGMAGLREAVLCVSYVEPYGRLVQSGFVLPA
jgi:hypothetical protein